MQTAIPGYLSEKLSFPYYTLIWLKFKVLIAQRQKKFGFLNAGVKIQDCFAKKDKKI